MRVLFVAGANNEGFGIAPLITIQGNSLQKAGIELSYFPIIGRGITGYLISVFKLRKFLKKYSFDIIHAHYSFAGLVAFLARPKVPIVVSLLGSDVNSVNIINKSILKLIPYLSWDALIVKSNEMSNNVKSKNYVIPNGVNLELFKPMNKILCQKELSWDTTKKHILFAANPNRPEKNFDLTLRAIDLLNNKNIELHCLENVDYENIPVWLNASDLIVLSSLWEGSPNVIKEAMACNRPIVATDVGDIKWLFGNEPGHFLSSFNSEEFSRLIELGIGYSDHFEKTNGRGRIIDLYLDSSSVAKKIIDVYKQCLK